ncbi:lysosomal acid phosphatase-like protein 3 [Leptotrombidium deliense]|uniref:Lysosomal acid phosphatase-like protein 3 n=1 Tax=Leptotrombidium deliense TaxID=299467 RepID=A0A443SMY3_9ACAR|nr:lysosomal acid phosphatase-like protein 3 [Leptotrombidium deliense]
MTFDCLIFLTVFCFAVTSAEIDRVIIISRHGDRTPTKSFPNDPYSNDSYWEDGWGQLTGAGKRRMLHLGQYLRKTYNKILSDNPREVEAQSSEASRCVESLLVMLAGLYPPKGRWQWHESINWQPIAIRVRESKSNGMLAKSRCPALESEMADIRRSKEVEELSKKHELILSKVEKFTSIGNVYKARHVMSTMQIQQQVGLQQPEWYTNEIQEEMKNIRGSLFHLDSSTKIVQRLKAGLIFREIRIILKKEKNRYRNKKLFLMSTHDNKINVFNKKPPPFGSSVIIELHNMSKNQYIRAYYLNETHTENAVPLMFPFCNSKSICPLPTFLKYIEEFIMKSWRKECKMQIVSESIESL